MVSRLLPAIAGAAALCGLCLPEQAAAVPFTFTQSGYSDGAVLSGFFEAEDLDANGEISSFEGEVSDFGATFPGNSLIPAFSLTPDNAVDLGFGAFSVVFRLNGSNILGDDETGDIEGMAFGVDNGGTGIELLAGPGPFNLCDGVVAECGELVSFPAASDISTNFVIVSSDAVVPLPASALLLITGLAAVGVAARRRA